MIRRVLVVVAALLGVVVLPAVEAQAIPMCKSGYACLYQYYSDPEYTVLVGYQSIDCAGHSELSGSRTRYLEFSQARCNS